MTSDTTSSFPAVSRFRTVVVNFMSHRNALIVCGIFLIVGIIICDDYGMSPDDVTQRALAISTVDYVMGNNDSFLYSWTKNYGVAFELSLLFFERILGLEDSRSIYLSRHLLTHLFFLAGGFFCYLLALRLFNNRLLAFFALLLFLLHPRMYAHSFFNTKDIPFLSMFMIAMFFIERAFRKETVGAFLLCGIGIGILTNIRILGIMLFAAVLAMRACDLFYATGRGERKHVLITTRGFAVACMITLYVTWPYLWTNPGRLIASFIEMAHYPYFVLELFQGERVSPIDLPLHYAPVWFLITTPPVVILLGIIGAGSIFFRGVLRPNDVFRSTQLRFGFLTLACFALPVLAVVLLGSTLYSGARQMYFLYAPFCVLAVFGLHGLASFFKRKPLQVGMYVLVGMGVAMMLASTIRIHPFQQVYFNFLVDRTTPEYLSSRYWMDHWGSGSLKVLEYLLEQYPSSPIYVADDFQHVGKTRMILPKADRQRVFIGIGIDGPNFSFFGGAPTDMQEIFDPSNIYTRKVYNNTILKAARLDLREAGEAMADAWRKTYRSAVSEEPVFSSNFNIYFNENNRTLTYVRESCRSDDIVPAFLLHVLPADPNDLPDEFKQDGYGSFNFFFYESGVVFDGKCVASFNLPEYEISRIRTGQYIPLIRSIVWHGDFSFSFGRKQSTEEAREK